jgi:hypothetical protein
LHRGRIQKAARRVLLALDGEATTRDVVDWGYCRKVQRGQRIEKTDYRHARAERLSELPIALGAVVVAAGRSCGG